MRKIGSEEDVVDHLKSDVIVIGSGAAGLRAAVAAAETGLGVLVISKGPPGKGTSTIMSLGVFAGALEGGNPDSHRRRTIRAGRGINQVELVDVLVQESGPRLKELVDWGVQCVARDGSLMTIGRPPVWAQGVIACLWDRAAKLGVRFVGGAVVQRILMGRESAGLLAYSTARADWFTLASKALILATGGAGALYLRHDNPQRMMGEAYTLALDAGAALQDMEFVQFFPLGLAEPGRPPFLISPRLADLGRLFNGKGEEILSKYGIQERPAAVHARDRLSQAVFREIYREGETVWLDLRGLSEEDWLENRGSSFFRERLGVRYGATRDPVRVAPMAHHVMGGVRIDARGATSVPGLFAAGEVTGGLHGANRMGGNALTDTLVFGARAGAAAASWAREVDGGDGQRIVGDLREFVPGSLEGGVGAKAADLKRELQRTLWEDGGILRNRQGLQRALGRVEEILNQASRLALGRDSRRTQEAIEIGLGARTAALVLEAALRREESRGAHFREDFPRQDDGRWRGHLQLRRSPEGESIWSYEPA